MSAPKAQPRYEYAVGCGYSDTIGIWMNERANEGFVFLSLGTSKDLPLVIMQRELT